MAPLTVRKIARSTLELLCIVSLMVMVGGCSEGLDAGSRCSDSGDCQGHLQCLDSICTPRCIEDVECGPGSLCNNYGECVSVRSNIGDTCRREQDCGAEHTCLLKRDADNDGFLYGTCQGENGGNFAGNRCERDDNCRTGICADGLCTQLCLSNRDCPLPFQCAIIILVEDTLRVTKEAKRFRGCYPFEPP